MNIAFIRPLSCFNRHDEMLYVNKVGMYKFGEDGTTRVGGFRTVISIYETPVTILSVHIQIRLGRIMASTFVPLPKDLLKFPSCVYVDRMDPDYVPGLVHANTLSWIRPGQKIERMFDTTDLRI